MSSIQDKIDQQAKEMMFGTCRISQPQEPIIADKLRDIFASMPAPDPTFNMNMHYPFGGLNFHEFNQRKLPDTFKPYSRLGGIRAVESNLSYPRFQLSEKVTVSDEFRQEMNAWLADFFGHVSLVPDDTVFGMGDVMIMNSRIMASLKANL
jgi:hypothetical protein